MRKGKKGRKLTTTREHRRALLTGLSNELFKRKQIITTTEKAKEARRMAERFITFAKRGDLSARRYVGRFIKDATVLKSLFSEIAPAFANRNGGYTRVIKLGQRPGDGAQLSILELVGFDVTSQKAEAAEKKRERKKKREEARKARMAGIEKKEEKETKKEKSAKKEKDSEK